MHSDTASVQSLAELVINKTDGNPFFVNEFLKTLYAENLLNFDVNRRTWQWDIAQIQARDITDNVVELMIGKLKQLPQSTQNLLSLAACVGANFSLNILAIICEKSPEEIYLELVEAVHAGVILPTSELDAQLFIQDYKFLHDRVYVLRLTHFTHQSFYGSIPLNLVRFAVCLDRVQSTSNF